MPPVEQRAKDRADALIGISGRDRRAAIKATREGLSIAAVDRLVQTGRLTLADLDRVVLPRKTLSNRRKIGTLTPEQSDRLVRVVRVIAAAEETFGSQERAARWLR